ncbi:uncharacterized protein LOC143040760 [Oratosquilla oratoria]|uniref:uncharacterized protein LOC143040760 n=1 Tax=Oratosquilla oratoria TaxID=337810 RepID=UPI003F75E65B
MRGMVSVGIIMTCILTCIHSRPAEAIYEVDSVTESELRDLLDLLFMSWEDMVTDSEDVYHRTSERDLGYSQGFPYNGLMIKMIHDISAKTAADSSELKKLEETIGLLSLRPEVLELSQLPTDLQVLIFPPRERKWDARSTSLPKRTISLSPSQSTPNKVEENEVINQLELLQPWIKLTNPTPHQPASLFNSHKQLHINLINPVQQGDQPSDQPLQPGKRTKSSNIKSSQLNEGLLQSLINLLRLPDQLDKTLGQSIHPSQQTATPKNSTQQPAPARNSTQQPRTSGTPPQQKEPPAQPRGTTYKKFPQETPVLEEPSEGASPLRRQPPAASTDTDRLGRRRRHRRSTSPKIIYRRKNKPRVCAGGGSSALFGGNNAFNYISFLANSISLVLNINNNVNNNNNNNNVNSNNNVDNNNANLNINQNNANQINIMPPGGKRKKRRSWLEAPRRPARPGPHTCPVPMSKELAQSLETTFRSLETIMSTREPLAHIM